MRRRIQPASVLQDLRRSGGQALATPRVVPTASGVGSVGSPAIGPQSILGGHYAETRNVIPFSFDDSIDPTHPLDCFFQMPEGVLKVYSAKLFVRADKFRAYETSSTSGGGSTTSASGGSTTSSSESFLLGGADPSSSGGDGAGHTHDGHTAGSSAHTTDSQALHNHGVSSAVDDSYGSHSHDTGIFNDRSVAHNHGGATGDAGTHSHNVNTHTHSQTHSTYQHSHTIGHSHLVPSHSHTNPAHQHTVDTTHTHGITYGIYESVASTGTLSAKVADDGTNFGAAVASGANITTDIKDNLSLTAGDRQLRIETAGAGAQARVKVLLMLDVLLKVNLD